MLSHFPHPYPDELLYSVFARYQARMQYPSGRAVVTELFDTGNVIAVVDLPSQIDRLLGNLPPGHRYTADWLIERCTTLPFYAPFLLPERLRQIQRDMRGSGGPGIQMRVGLMASSIPYPERLRFCPQCVAADRSQFSESYWHRQHQLSGIIVCPEHRVFLEDGSIRARNAPTRYLFTAADEVVGDNPARPLDDTQLEHQHLLQLAVDAAWLLDQQVKLADPTERRQRYLRLFAQRDLATHTGQMRLASLVEAFVQFYTPGLLAKLHCQLNPASRDTWLSRLIRRPERAQHPLQHLLLIRFLGYSAADFFKMPALPSHFGPGPWPCLNPTCPSYRQPVINACRIGYSRDSRRPVGSFACRCGFEYARLGPDRTPDDRFCLSRVTRYGPIWEERLRQMWPDPTISLRELARQLGVDPQTAARYAAQLELQFPRPGHRHGQVPTINDKKTETPGRSDSRAVRRQRWIAALVDQPEAGVNQLRKQCGSTFNWLYRHDREWLTQHKPQARPVHAPERVDWDRRDIVIAIACLQAALQIVQTSDKPTRLTHTAVTRKAGHDAIIRQRWTRLAHTIFVLERLVESRQDFALRRIEWAAAEFGRAGITPKRWQLIRRSGTDRVKHWPAIQLALDRAAARQEASIEPAMPLRNGLIEKISRLLRQYEAEQRNYYSN